MNHLDTFSRIVTDTVEPLAQRMDSEARFPRETIAALGEAGLLGLVSATSVAGLGLGLREASKVVSRIAQARPSTAMIVWIHCCVTVVIETSDKNALRQAIARGLHQSTLAFSEADSRSHFWAPTGTARADADGVLLGGPPRPPDAARLRAWRGRAAGRPTLAQLHVTP